MTRRSLALPQAPSSVDDALGLVCTLPSADRRGRRSSVHSTVAQAVNVRELINGVALSFTASEENARMLLDLMLAERECCAQFRYSIVDAPPHEMIELHVETVGTAAQPLKALYLGLAREAGFDV